MLVPLKKLPIVAPFYEGVTETLVWSALDGSMGWAFVDNMDIPGCAALGVGDFIFPAGDAESPGAVRLLHEAQKALQGPIAIIVPPDEQWQTLVARKFPCSNNGAPVARYATHKQTVFDKDKLQKLVETLPFEYELVPIDDALYHHCMAQPRFRDFCFNFLSAKDYAARGIGFAVLYYGMVVGGASSYTIYKGGIEIEVDVAPDHRRKGLAAAASAKLILACMEAGLYPSWDAANPESLALAQKLGYEAAGEYPAYVVTTQKLFTEW